MSFAVYGTSFGSAQTQIAWFCDSFIGMSLEKFSAENFRLGAFRLAINEQSAPLKVLS
jgi:hypothetical protein